MPVMPGYIHADIPHERTIQRADYLYGCSSGFISNSEAFTAGDS